MDTEPDLDIPAWEDFLHPILRVLHAREPLNIVDLSEAVYPDLGLTEAQTSFTLPWKQDAEVAYAVNDAVSLLLRSKALAKTRDRHCLTAVGARLLDDHPDTLTVADIMDLPSYRKNRPAAAARALAGAGVGNRSFGVVALHTAWTITATLLAGAIVGLIVFALLGFSWALITFFTGGSLQTVPLWLILVPAGAGTLAVLAGIVALTVQAALRPRSGSVTKDVAGGLADASDTATAFLALAFAGLRGLMD